MKSPHRYLFLILLMAAFGCTPSTDTPEDENLNATLWMQTSVEYAMSARQAYMLAQKNLAEALNDPEWTAATEQQGEYSGLPPALILDVDETVLDNSPFQARLVSQGIDFRQDLWETWVRETRAEPVEGAKEFIRFARENKVTVFYVTNRRLKEPTVVNLREKLDPLVTEDAVLCQNERPEWGSDKSSRRALIAAQHRVILLIGDDYNDFVSLGKLAPQERLAASAGHRERWGREWIILPNPAYGHWESTLYDYVYDLPEKTKLEKKFSWLRTE